MAKFFAGWPLWEKLVFILACGIVITILLGCAKLFHTHWKLRKYSAVAEKERREQSLQRQMSQRSRRQTDDVPFGIRAIESGIEVEGVWISRSNTPEPLSRDSSATSVWDIPRKASYPDLEKQDQLQGQGGAVSGSTSTFPASVSRPLTRDVSRDQWSSSKTSRDPSPDSVASKLPHGLHPPLAFAKYSLTPYLPRRDSTSSTLEALDAVYRASGMLPESETGNDSGGASSSSIDTGPISASAPNLLNDTQRTRSSFDLELMQCHRMSLAAEVGQLTPRTRRAGNGSERASIASTLHLNDYFTSPQKNPVSSSDQAATPNKDANASQSLEAAARPRESQTLAMPNVTPFAQFCQSNPPSPPDEAPRVSSESGEGTKLASLPPSPTTASFTTTSGTIVPRLSSDSGEAQRPSSLPASARTASFTTTSNTIVEDPERSSQHEKTPRVSFEKRKSDILRGQGTGFEILLPGTLKVPSTPAADEPESPLEKQRAHPPLSLHKYSRAARERASHSSSTESQRRRLQKKRRPSDESWASDESGRRSRASML